MYIENLSNLNETKFNIWSSFLKKCGLEPDLSVSQTVLLWDGETLIATGSRQDNLLKCIAVDESRQGEGHTATIITSLRKEAFNEGYNHLFLYTKPENKTMFSSLFFYPVAQTDKVLLMENRKDGIKSFLNILFKKQSSGIIGSCIMNCNPFTLGHRYLIETAARECDLLYVFVVSEDKSFFSFDDRFQMVKLGTSDIPNVIVNPTGPYLISSTTFPTYFLKERERISEFQCLLDIEIFSKYFAPKFNITRRYVGTEPISPMTNQYNKALKEHLPKQGIELKELSRLELNKTPVSASFVRSLIEKKDTETIKTLVPDTTFNYLQTKSLI